MMTLIPLAGKRLHIFDQSLKHLYLSDLEQLHAVQLDIDISADDDATIAAVKSYAIGRHLISQHDEICLLV
jgi:hypothetical protein